MTSRRRTLLLVCLFFSGASGLVYELLWTRWFGLVFGTMAVSVSAVLAAFFLGLAAGAHWGGRWASRLRRPFLAYGVLEAAIAVFGLLSYPLIRGLGALEVALGATDPGVLLLLRFMAALVVLFPPTVAMGATLPVLLWGLVRRARDAGGATAVVYGTNTLGAVLGAYGTAYHLMPRLGSGGTLAVAVVLNLAIAAVVAIGFRDREETDETLPAPAELPAVASRASEPSALESPASGSPGSGRPGSGLPEPEPSFEPPSSELPATTGVAPRLLLALAAAAGFVAIALEVILTRLLSVMLEGTIYSFGAVLAIFLAGIGLGSLLALRRLAALGGNARAGFSLYAGLMLAAFAGVVLPLLVLPWGHYGLLALERGLGGVWAMHAKLLLSALLLLPLATAFGAAFPLLVSLYRGAGSAAEGLGRIYAVNTVGAIVGSASAGLVLVPAIGTDATLQLLLALLATMAVLGAAAARRFGVAALALGMWLVFAALWSGTRLAGLMRSHVEPDFASFLREMRTADERLLYFAEGRSGTVAVYRDAQGAWSLFINGLSQAGGYPTPPPYGAESVMLALLPYALHPDPRSALVIGYGGGVTTDVLNHTERIERVRVIEIEPRVLDAVAAVHPPGAAPHDHRRVEVVLADGRNALLRDPETFDLVLSHLTDPWLSGAAGLATREFFALVKKRLAPGGMLMVWLGSFGETHARSVAGALSQVFDDLLVVGVDSTTYLLASDAPFVLDPERIDRRASERGLAPFVAPMGFDRAERLLYAILGAGRATPSDVPPNTDDNAFVEVALPLVRHDAHVRLADLPRAVLTEPALTPGRFASGGERHVLELLEWELGTPGGAPPPRDDPTLLLRLRRPMRARILFETNSEHLDPQVARYLAGRLALAEGRRREAVATLAAVAPAPEYPAPGDPAPTGTASASPVYRRARLFLALAHRLGGEPEAVEVAAALAAAGDVDGAYLYGLWALETDPEGARRALERVRGRFPRAAVHLARDAAARGVADLAPWRDDLRRAIRDDPYDHEAHALLALAAERDGAALAAQRHRLLAADAARRRARELAERAMGFVRGKQHRPAAALWRRALALDPTAVDSWLGLAAAQLAAGDRAGAERTAAEARQNVRDPARFAVLWARRLAAAEASENPR